MNENHAHPQGTCRSCFPFFPPFFFSKFGLKGGFFPPILLQLVGAFFLSSSPLFLRFRVSKGLGLIVLRHQLLLVEFAVLPASSVFSFLLALWKVCFFGRSGQAFSRSLLLFLASAFRWDPSLFFLGWVILLSTEQSPETRPQRPLYLPPLVPLAPARRAGLFFFWSGAIRGRPLGPLAVSFRSLIEDTYSGILFSSCACAPGQKPLLPHVFRPSFRMFSCSARSCADNSPVLPEVSLVSRWLCCFKRPRGGLRPFFA